MHHIRGSIHKTEDRDIDMRNRIRSLCGVGLVEEIITRETVHSTRVAGLRYIVCKRHKLLEMLIRVFHISMQHWITNR